MSPVQLGACNDFCATVVRGIRPNEETSVALLIDIFKNPPGAEPEQPTIATNEFGFGVDLASASVVVHVVGATMALAHTYLSARALNQERETTQRLQAHWSRLLVEYGLDRELAVSIPLTHAGDLAVFLESLRKLERTRNETAGRDDDKSTRST